MKTLFSSLILSLFWINANAQKIYSTPFYVGLDVLKGLPSYVFPEKYFIRKTAIIEPYIRFNRQKPRRSILFSAGFANGSSKVDTSLQIRSHQFQGVYFKMAFEATNQRIPLSVGVGPMLSIAGFKGKYQFKGPTFGDYTNNFHIKEIMAFGAEGYLAYDLSLNKKLSLRFLIRNTLAIRSGDTFYPDFFPGIGYTKDMPKYMVSGGFSTQLYFRCK
ncbi:hypothetical protein L0657_19505 [Dyadobacter sp. CY345]|uniref:hypothetical protein n=1 Tax=Dyadobacter sp. CY345 TaxID=2909335 RepID=UPI001F1EEAB1|nr:hypothetical protein [Dyadobacter sp. CY345]MCF2446153.1 hypothetical protein [Dyadobacter sp. CY345]